MKLNRKTENFAQDGYIVLDYYSTEYLVQFKEIILQKLRSILNDETVTLETFHEYVSDDGEVVMFPPATIQDFLQ